jgi:Ca-activated chloride channel family protein
MDELEKLRRAFKESEPPPASERGRRAAIAAALEAYEAGEIRRRQGFRPLERLIRAAQAGLRVLKETMSMRPTYTLAGGVSLLAITVVALSAINLQRVPAYAPRNEIAPAAAPTALRDAKTDALKAAKPASIAATRPEAQSPGPEAAPVPPAALPESELDKPAESRDLAGSDLGRVDAMASVAGVAPPASLTAKQSVAADERIPPGYHDQGRDRFQPITTNPLKVTAEEPVSTFSIDVDTASYSFMRASLNQGVLPQKDAVRVEELINYFPYEYPVPATREEPFKPSVTVIPTPWNAKTRLIDIAIKGFEVTPAERPKANLVFLIDTSGSMDESNKLPLLVNSMKLLVDTLRPDDTVAIVTYAGNAGTALEPTRGSDKGKIIAALENLSAGGSTAGAEGIRQAYLLAERNLDKSAVNRVILATDGDFNVGITSGDELKAFVERERQTGVYLSVLGFGRGNYNDELMQTLAQNGNGVAAYIDTLGEARKVLVQESSSTLVPIAKDVKIQVEFNPAEVAEYRLIGYETRMLAREDFNNDRVDAGEIGSGHAVTALYEITPNAGGDRLVDDLRYGKATPSAPADAAGAKSGELGFLKIRYKLPDSDTSRLIEAPIAAKADDSQDPTLAREARFAAAVAGFGQMLRGGQYTGGFGYDDVAALAEANKGRDEFGYRAEFINLVRLAKSAASLETEQR